MSAFPEASPGEPSDLDLVLIHRNNLYARTVEQQIELAPTCLSLSTLDYHRRFQQIGRR